MEKRIKDLQKQLDANPKDIISKHHIEMYEEEINELKKSQL